MRIVQAVFGTFHHFELARELERRGHLTKIYSTFPWQRLKREGLPREKVDTFPWFQTPEYLLLKWGIWNGWLFDHFNFAGVLAFDEWTMRRIPDCDVFVAISGAGLKTGRLVQQRGGSFVCDRGSSHVRHRAELITAELARWGVKEKRKEGPRDLEREETLYAEADAITVPSTYAKRTYMERGIAEKIHQIPYGVLLERFSKVGEPPADRFEVLYVGRVGLPKGFPYLLQAFAKLPLANKHLTVVGGMDADMGEVLAKLPQEHVSYEGTVPQVQLKEWMSRSHVMVMPSLDEGMALVQGQAMACGCPVIGTTNSGSEDLVTEGKDGFIVEVRDADALAERMMRIASSPALRQEMSENALVKVRSLGGWRQYGNRWEQLARELMEARKH